MRALTIALDESGAKGYSDNQEQIPGELGVVAGILVPSEHIERFEFEITEILTSYKHDGKLHITDLTPSQQETLRQEVFDYLSAKGVRWVYEATYVEGFFANAQLLNSIIEQAKPSRRSNIKLSGNEQKDSLHTDLLVGAFGKAVAFCNDYIAHEIELNVITDRIDKPIIKTFEVDAKRLLGIEEPLTHKVTGFDPDKKEVVEGSITTQISGDVETFGDFSGVSFEISISESPLTVVADILANSVHYHLKEMQHESVGVPLNTYHSISKHPLANLVYEVNDQSAIPQVSDTIYQHPESSKS